jgi:hypothetical protein
MLYLLWVENWIADWNVSFRKVEKTITKNVTRMMGCTEETSGSLGAPNIVEVKQAGRL